MSDNDNTPHPVTDFDYIETLKTWLDLHDNIERLSTPTALIDAVMWSDLKLRQTFEDNDSELQYPAYAARLILRDMLCEVLTLRIAQVRLNARLDETRGIKAPEGV